MIIEIKVIPNAKKEEIIETEGNITVKTTTQPENNKANESVVRILSKHLKIPKSKIQIIKGHKSRNKTIELSTSPKPLQDNSQ